MVLLITRGTGRGMARADQTGARGGGVGGGGDGQAEKWWLESCGYRTKWLKLRGRVSDKLTYRKTWGQGSRTSQTNKNELGPMMEGGMNDSRP